MNTQQVRPAVRESILRLLGACPRDTRGMFGLCRMVNHDTGATADEVNAALRALEQAGEIEKRRDMWRIPDSGTTQRR